jgi:hypothetical protein
MATSQILDSASFCGLFLERSGSVSKLEQPAQFVLRDDGRAVSPQDEGIERLDV